MLRQATARATSELSPRVCVSGKEACRVTPEPQELADIPYPFTPQRSEVWAPEAQAVAGEFRQSCAALYPIQLRALGWGLGISIFESSQVIPKCIQGGSPTGLTLEVKAPGSEASPGRLLEMQSLGPLLDLVTQNLHFPQDPRRSVCSLGFGGARR